MVFHLQKILELKGKKALEQQKVDAKLERMRILTKQVEDSKYTIKSRQCDMLMQCHFNIWVTFPG